MDPITLGIIGGLFGLGKGAGGNATASAQNRLRAETSRYSPWTNLKAGEFQTHNTLGDILGGATTGAMLGQGLKMLGGAGGGAGLWGNAGGVSPMSANLWASPDLASRFSLGAGGLGMPVAKYGLGVDTGLGG